MSRFFALLGTAIRPLAVYLVLWLAARPAWAQDPTDQGSQADWVMSYALVILSIGLGVFMVCRPGRRGQDIRRPQ